ncbi:serine hydrolase domain-containing protein [Spirillospora sp. NPDC049024]
MPGTFSALAARLEAARLTRAVPGASLAILDDGRLVTAAAGVTNVMTGVPVTPQSLFQTGSITKVWTAALVMQLVEERALSLDTAIDDVLPAPRGGASASSFGTATVRHALSHMSGIDGDFFTDTGRGDDCLERYVELCRTHQMIFKPGTGVSYSNAGYVVLGRIIELLTRRSWDRALAERLIEPLGLRATVTLPEEALRFSTAIGHFSGEPADPWSLPRSNGPAGAICATAADVVAFARAFLPDPPVSILSADGIGRMRCLEGRLPYAVPWPLRGWGLAWEIYDWGGTTGFGHGGRSAGQNAYLRILPEHNAVFVLLANGGDSRALFEDMFTAEAAERWNCDVTHYLPSSDTQPCNDGLLDGMYARLGTRLTVSSSSTGAELVVTDTRITGESERHAVVRSEDGGVYARTSASGVLSPLSLIDIAGESYLHFGMRANRRIP